MKVCCALALIVASQWAGAQGAEPAPLGRYDYWPYQVSVSIAFSRDAETTESFRQSVCSALQTRLEQTFGAVWVLAPQSGVRIDNHLTPADQSGLDRLTYAAAAEQLAQNPCDKAYFVTISREGAKWVVAGREWDRTLQMLGGAVSETTIERRCVPDTALAVIKRLFSPLLMVNDADRESKSAVLTVRAGSIPFGDPKFEPLKSGDMLRAVFRFLDSKRSVRSIQSVPWTYLVLEQPVDGHSQVKATIVSSYRAPLAANMRRRVEAIAVRSRPELPETRLQLIAGRNPPHPQGGLFVSISDFATTPAPRPSPPKEGASPPPPATATPKMRLLSDRRGEVTIPADPQHPIVTVEVHSGSAILLRRPFVPGIDPQMTLEIADDHVRLSAEREIDILESQLIEAVAKRGALFARTRAALKRSEVKEAQDLLAEIGRLPPPTDYLGQLNQIRVLALDEAHNRRDRVAERRIEDLCNKTLERITQYLPDDRIATFKEEIEKILSVQKVAKELQNAPMRRARTDMQPPVAPLKRRDATQPPEKKAASPTPAPTI
jgi:hypothetical protein